MIQIVNSVNKTLLYKSPHVYHTVEDNSVVPGITISVNSGTLFTPIYSEKGPTDVVKYFSGPTAMTDMINTFGQPNTRKLGLAYTAAYEHVAAGGNVALISVKDSSATCAGFIVNLVIETKETNNTAIKKTLGWIKPDGSAFVEDPTADVSRRPGNVSQDHIVHQIESARIRFEVEEISGVKNVDTLKLLVNTKFVAAKSSTGNKKVFPFIYGLYKGKGKYGNNFRMLFNTLGRTQNGKPYFETNVYDRRETSFVERTKQPVSLSTIRIDSEPLFIERRYAKPISTGDFYIGTLDNMQFNHIGKEIKKVLDGLNLFPFTSSLGGLAAQALEEDWQEAKDLFDEPDDDDFHRMSLVDPTNLEGVGKFLDTNNLTSADFTGGSEGVLEDLSKRGWNWDDTYNVASGGSLEKQEKVLQNLFANAYQGINSQDVFNLIANPCDYIIDMGYPMEVKKAMVTFSTNRDDVQILFNAPLDKVDISQLLAWKQGFDIKGRNIYYYPGSFEFVDNKTDRSFRVPETFAVMYNVLSHYKNNGFALPVAGIEHGSITGVETGSGRGFGNMSLKENDRLFEAGFNICSSFTEGLVYLDSQKSNYLLTEISALQEFHNNSITNRILKKLYMSLQYEKHRLNSPEAVSKITFKIDNELKSEFVGKVRDLSYSGAFESSYAESIGQMTHAIGIQYFVGIKYHFINLKALPTA